MGTKQSLPKNLSRRKILKKIRNSTIFVVPTLVSFKVSKLQARTSFSKSSPPPPPSEW